MANDLLVWRLVRCAVLVCGFWVVWRLVRCAVLVCVDAGWSGYWSEVDGCRVFCCV